MKKLFQFFLWEGKVVLLGYLLLVLSLITLIVVFPFYFPDVPLVAIVSGGGMLLGIYVLIRTEFGSDVYEAYKMCLEARKIKINKLQLAEILHSVKIKKKSLLKIEHCELN